MPWPLIVILFGSAAFGSKTLPRGIAPADPGWIPVRRPGHRLEANLQVVAPFQSERALRPPSEVRRPSATNLGEQGHQQILDPVPLVDLKFLSAFAASDAGTSDRRTSRARRRSRLHHRWNGPRTIRPARGWELPSSVPTRQRARRPEPASWPRASWRPSSEQPWSERPWQPPSSAQQPSRPISSQTSWLPWPAFRSRLGRFLRSLLCCLLGSLLRHQKLLFLLALLLFCLSHLDPPVATDHRPSGRLPRG